MFCKVDEHVLLDDIFDHFIVIRFNYLKTLNSFLLPFRRK